jgi:hypothetical protein
MNSNVNIPTNYRYHPEGKDTQVLCQLFEKQLPDNTFGFDIDRSGKLRIKSWSRDKARYYEQLLHDYHEPKQVAELFAEKCGTRFILLS